VGQRLAWQGPLRGLMHGATRVCFRRPHLYLSVASLAYFPLSVLRERLESHAAQWRVCTARLCSSLSIHAVRGTIQLLRREHTLLWSFVVSRREVKVKEEISGNTMRPHPVTSFTSKTSRIETMPQAFAQFAIYPTPACKRNTQIIKCSHICR
jgi:hypothetical protein